MHDVLACSQLKLLKRDLCCINAMSFVVSNKQFILI